MKGFSTIGGFLVLDMDELSEAWRNLNLKEEEWNEIAVEEVNVAELRRCERKSLVGKVFTNRKVSLELLRSTMLKIWRVESPPVFKGIRD